MTGRTPSARYYPNTNSIGCFGCHHGGGPIHFVMNMEGISFKEAIKLLCTWYKIEELPDFSYKEYAKKLAAQENQYNRKIKFSAIASMLEQLDFNNKDEMFKLSYLFCNLNLIPYNDFIKYTLQLRSVPIDEFIYQFEDAVRFRSKENIEFAQSLIPDAFATTRAFDEFAVNAGLAVSAPERWEEMQGRFVFPIFLPGKLIVGFSGRSLQPHILKYLTHFDFGFDKADILYGLDVALPAIKEKGYIIVCEGILDVLRCRSAGFNNVVASMATYLSEEQVVLLKAVTDKFLLIFDGDQGGDAAFTKTTKSLDKYRLLYERIKLPDGEDPDSFGKKHLEKLTQLISSKW